jgi:hypothetical protein
VSRLHALLRPRLCQLCQPVRRGLSGVRFFLNDVERFDVTVADSEAGTITICGVERKGQVAIRLDK